MVRPGLKGGPMGPAARPKAVYDKAATKTRKAMIECLVFNLQECYQISVIEALQSRRC